jgi:hypothetical protein
MLGRAVVAGMVCYGCHVMTDYLFATNSRRRSRLCIWFSQSESGSEEGRRVELYMANSNPRPGGPSLLRRPPLVTCPALCILPFILPYLESSTDRLTSWNRSVSCGLFHLFCWFRLGEYVIPFQLVTQRERPGFLKGLPTLRKRRSIQIHVCLRAL